MHKPHDLNWAFFTEIVLEGEHRILLNRIRAHYASCRTPVEGVTVALELDSALRAAFDRWALENSGYSVSFRNFGAPFDRRTPSEVRRFVEGDSSPFDAVFCSALARKLGGIVGINLSVEDQILPAFRLAGMIRNRLPETPVIWGGSLLARIYPSLIEHFGDLWDYLVVREGEEPLLEILNDVEEVGFYSGTDDRVIAHGRSRGFSIAAPFMSRAVTDISATGMANFDDYAVDEYLSLDPMLPVLASRKCYWGRCKFCTIHESWDPKARQRQATDVVKELDLLVKTYGVRCFRFVDEACPPNLLREALPDLSRLDIDFEIYAIAEARFKDQEFVAALGSAGCRQAYFGLESVDPEALAAMDKKINQSRHYSVIFGNCALAGIHVYVYTLFGYPGSSLAAERDTVRYLIEETAVQCATIASFVPVTGSPFALDNSSHLAHTGRMTEDFEVVQLRDTADPLEITARLSAQDAVKSVYSKRTDLALAALLNDEMRFSLSRRFGADYALRAVESGLLDEALIRDHGVNTMLRERVNRSIDQ